MEQLTDLCDKQGFTLARMVKGRAFELTHRESGEWGWILHPDTDSIVTRAREIPRGEWPRVLEYNFNRLKAKATKK